MKKSLFLLVAIAVLFFSCSSTKVSKEQEEAELFVPPVGGMDAEISQDILCDLNGQILNEYATLPPIFEDTDVTVLSTNMHYTFYEKKCISNFELIYVNVKPEKFGAIKRNEVIGKATKDSIGIFIRCEEIDNYLVSISHTMPLFWNDHWYYYAGFLDSSHMKFLDFLPMNDSQLKKLYDTFPSINNSTEMNISVLLKTSLQEMPTLSPDGTGTQILNHQGVLFSLNWQKGFYAYLEDEYNLNDEIYLYLNLVRCINYKGKPCFVSYVRDFSLVPPEKIVEDRVEMILAQNADVFKQ